MFELKSSYKAYLHLNEPDGQARALSLKQFLPFSAILACPFALWLRMACCEQGKLLPFQPERDKLPI